MPKPLSGSEKGPGYVYTWLFQMELYFAASHVRQEEWTVVAATNLEGIAALWLQQQAVHVDLRTVTWEQFKQEMVNAVVPADLQLRNMDALLDCK